MMQDEPPISVPLSWVGVDEIVASAANQFLVQFDGSVHYLTIGQVTPPILLGTDEERKLQLAALPMVPVKPLGSFALSPKAIKELVGVLTTHLESTDPTGGGPTS